MEILGLPLGLVALVAVLVTNRWATFNVVALCIALAFVGLWMGTNGPSCGDIGTEIEIAMCHQSHSVWDAYRLLTFGLPGLVVFVVWGFKFKRMARERADERRFSNPTA